MRNLFSRVVVSCVLFLIPLIPAPAQTVDENNGWNGQIITSIGQDGSDYYAQAFIADLTTITKFGVVIRELYPEGQIRMAIAADNAGVPNYAAPLYVGTLINPTTTATWYYESGLNIAVTPGQKYYVLLDGYNIPGTTGQSGIGYSDTQPIAGQGIQWSNYGGVGPWETIASYPLAIYVEGIAPPPAPSGLVPSAGPVEGGQTVTITGSYLSGVTAVTFGGVAATIVGATATSVTVRTPAHAIGVVDVVVTTSIGSATLAGGYTYLDGKLVPTLSTWMLGLLAAALAGVGVYRLRS